MSDLDPLFRLAEAYRTHTGLADTTLSRMVLHRNDRLRILREGGSEIGVRRLRRAIVWFAAHWPHDLPWPADIERPGAEEIAAAAEDTLDASAQNTPAAEPAA